MNLAAIRQTHTTRSGVTTVRHAIIDLDTDELVDLRETTGRVYTAVKVDHDGRAITWSGSGRLDSEPRVLYVVEATLPRGALSRYRAARRRIVALGRLNGWARGTKYANNVADRAPLMREVVTKARKAGATDDEMREAVRSAGLTTDDSDTLLELLDLS